VTASRRYANEIARTDWIGERNMDKVDPVCAIAVVVLEALVGA
jgi:hypothetical protein